MVVSPQGFAPNAFALVGGSCSGFVGVDGDVGRAGGNHTFAFQLCRRGLRWFVCLFHEFLCASVRDELSVNGFLSVYDIDLSALWNHDAAATKVIDALLLCCIGSEGDDTGGFAVFDNSYAR